MNSSTSKRYRTSDNSKFSPGCRGFFLTGDMSNSFSMMNDFLNVLSDAIPLEMSQVFADLKLNTPPNIIFPIKDMSPPDIQCYINYLKFSISLSESFTFENASPYLFFRFTTRMTLYTKKIKIDAKKLKKWDRTRHYLSNNPNNENIPNTFNSPYIDFLPNLLNDCQHNLGKLHNSMIYKYLSKFYTFHDYLFDRINISRLYQILMIRTLFGQQYLCSKVLNTIYPAETTSITTVKNVITNISESLFTFFQSSSYISSLSQPLDPNLNPEKRDTLAIYVNIKIRSSTVKFVEDFDEFTSQCLLPSVQQLQSKLKPSNIIHNAVNSETNTESESGPSNDSMLPKIQFVSLNANICPKSKSHPKPQLLLQILFWKAYMAVSLLYDYQFLTGFNFNSACTTNPTHTTSQPQYTLSQDSEVGFPRFKLLTTIKL